MPHEFDPNALAKRLRQDSLARRKKPYRTSRLDKYTGELLRLHEAGARPAELQRWLLEQRVRVTHSTVARWLKRKGVKNGEVC